jgi:hypothetical protein
MPILWRVYRRYQDEFEGHSLGARPDCLHAEKDLVVVAAGKAPEIVKRLCCPELISEDEIGRIIRQHMAMRNDSSPR